jgi:hypothetical protein
MTKTEACRRVALAALLTGAMTVAHEARANPGFKITVNGLDLNGFAERGAFPTGDSPDGAEIVVGARPPTPDPDPKRSSPPAASRSPPGGERTSRAAAARTRSEPPPPALPGPGAVLAINDLRRPCLV